MGRRNRRAGAGALSMNIIVDGQLREEHDAGSECQRGTAVDSSGQEFLGRGALITLDEIVDGRSIMGIEIYPSIANAPPS